MALNLSKLLRKPSSEEVITRKMTGVRFAVIGAREAGVNENTIMQVVANALNDFRSIGGMDT